MAVRPTTLGLTIRTHFRHVALRLVGWQVHGGNAISTTKNKRMQAVALTPFPFSRGPF